MDVPTIPGYSEVLNRFRERRNEKEKLYAIFDRYRKEKRFDQAKSVLCIGPGTGQYDLEFIKRCVPNVRRVVALDIDKWCLDVFRAEAEKLLPGAAVETWDGKSEEWVNEGGAFDAVLAFHVLYEVQPHSRRLLLRRLFNEWLAPSGLFIYNIILNEYVDGGVNIVSAFKEYLGNFRLDNFASDLTGVPEEEGGKVLEKVKYQCDIDYRWVVWCRDVWWRVVWCGMVWCGVVWCGVVWCGVVWCGVVWCGVVWCCVAWCGVVWCGVVWCGVVWCGVVWCGVVWCGVVWCGVVWCGVVWCGVVWCGVVWCGVVWCGVVWCGVVWCSVVRVILSNKSEELKRKSFEKFNGKNGHKTPAKLLKNYGKTSTGNTTLTCFR